MENLPPYIAQQTDDVEMVFAGALGEGWEFEALQLSPGPLGFRASLVQLPDMAIFWTRVAASIHMQEYHRHEAVFLGFLLEASAAPRWRGRTLAPDQGLLYLPGQEQDYVLPRESLTLGFMIRRRLLRRMGWAFPQQGLIRLERRQIQDLAARAGTVTRMFRDGTAQTDTEIAILQDHLTLHLARLLNGRCSGKTSHTERDWPPARQFLLAKRAYQLMREWDCAKKLDVAELAGSLSTSPRSLYRAFHHCFGIGPYAYFTLLRLQALRQRIRQGAGTRGVITDAANSFGFWHLGRFSDLYRNQYGESPRDSLRRWRQENQTHSLQGLPETPAVEMPGRNSPMSC